jgi:hypothetical protein
MAAASRRRSDELEIADGRALIKRAGVIVGVLAVVTLILCVTLLMVPSLLLMFGLVIWAGRCYTGGEEAPRGCRERALFAPFRADMKTGGPLAYNSRTPFGSST